MQMLVSRLTSSMAFMVAVQEMQRGRHCRIGVAPRGTNFMATASSDEAAIRVERDGAIATVLLCNVAKLNALTVSMWQTLKREIDHLSADDALRCVIVRGAGRHAFAAGADIAEFATARDNIEQGKRYHRELVAGALAAIDNCRHPTVAMI